MRGFLACCSFGLRIILDAAQNLVFNYSTVTSNLIDGMASDSKFYGYLLHVAKKGTAKPALKEIIPGHLHLLACYIFSKVRRPP